MIRLNKKAASLLEELLEKKKNSSKIRERSLSPRRYEMLQTIKDHKSVSFDFLKRRFMGVSGRMLRYDLKFLQDKGFIIKRGVTKGALYEPLKVS
jgi:predicted transcriptional regulator